MPKRFPDGKSIIIAGLVAYVVLSSRGETAAPQQGPRVIDGDVVIRGNLTVTGAITVSGKITGRELRTTAGLVRWGDDDSKETLDQTVFLQRKCGSRNEQSALVQQPAGGANGALWLQIPGDQLPAGSIAAQVLQYGPLKEGNPRRQRFSPGTVFVQGDGAPFATISTTLSGSGDAKGLRPMPVLLNHDSVPTARLDGSGFKVVPAEARPTEPK